MKQMKHSGRLGALLFWAGLLTICWQAANAQVPRPPMPIPGIPTQPRPPIPITIRPPPAPIPAKLTPPPVARRQRFWDRRRPNLRESLAHSV